MGDSLFRRSWQVQVDNLDVSNLDLEFTVKRDLTPVPNLCSLTVWNLNKDHRAQLLKRNRLMAQDATTITGIPVQIQAGYVGNISTIFTGDLSEVSSVIDGPDWKTTISSEDGGRAFREGRINATFAKGVDFTTIVTQVVDKLGVGIGNAVSQMLGKEMPGIGKTTTHSKTVSGSASKHLDKIFNSLGLTYSVQNGVLQVLPPGGTLNQSAIQLSPSTGLIGSPESAVDSTVGQGNAQSGNGVAPGVIKLRSLIIPGLVPGRKIVVQSRDFDNIGYYITEITYTGQSWSNDWFAEIVARTY